MGQPRGFRTPSPYAYKGVDHPVELYVAPNGSDNNSGGVDQPLRTALEAARRVPDIVDYPFTIYLSPGIYQPPSLRRVLVNASVSFVGLGSVTVRTGTIGAGTTARTVVVAGGGLTANAHRGQFLQIGTEKRLIAKNDTTTIYLGAGLTAAPPDGTTFVVFRPPEVIFDFDLGDKTPLFGSEGSGPDITGDFIERGVIYANMRWTAAISSTFSPVVIARGYMSLFGIEVTGRGPTNFRMANGASVRIGRVLLNPATTPPAPADPVAAGLTPNNMDWHGYGMSWTSPDLTARVGLRGLGVVAGHITAPGLEVGLGARCYYFGGSLFGLPSGETVIVGTGSTVGGVAAGGVSGGIVELHATASLNDFFEILGNTLAPAVVVQGASVMTYSNTNADIIAGAGQPGVVVQQAGTFHYLDGDIVGGSYGLLVKRGGRAFLIDDGADEVAGGTADFAAGPTPAVKTGPFAIGEMLKEAAYADYDGSYILRLS